MINLHIYINSYNENHDATNLLFLLITFLIEKILCLRKFYEYTVPLIQIFVTSFLSVFREKHHFPLWNFDNKNMMLSHGFLDSLFFMTPIGQFLFHYYREEMIKKRLILTYTLLSLLFREKIYHQFINKSHFNPETCLRIFLKKNF